MILILQKTLNKEENLELENQLLPYQSFHSLLFSNQQIVVSEDTAWKATKQQLLNFPFVKGIIEHNEPYPLVSKCLKKENTIVKVNDLFVGGTLLTIIAGPCSIENFSQLNNTAKLIQETKAHILRGGAFKPRSSPYSFQGLKEEGLKILKEFKQTNTIPIISEIVDANQIPLFNETVDIIQIGARNMQNYQLLKALAENNKPVLLKRNPANTIEEWLMSAEYLLAGGNFNVILCERGNKTYDPLLPVSLNLNNIKTVKSLTHLPLLVDPSHACGDSDLVSDSALSAILAGADGLMIEVHEYPQRALSDGKQSLDFIQFSSLMEKLQELSVSIGRPLQ